MISQGRLTNLPLWIALLAFLGGQIWFVQHTRALRTAIEDMPPPPTQTALSAMAFGDSEFLFRHLGRWLQGVGDGGGRVKPLRDYNYDDVVGWLRTLDGLNRNSEFVHNLAAKYFGKVDISPERVSKIAFYLRDVALLDPVHRWPWIVWVANAIRSPLKDHGFAILVARDLESESFRNPAIPAWVRLLPVRLYHFAGDDVAAKAALEALSPADREAIEKDVQDLRDRLAGLKK